MPGPLNRELNEIFYTLHCWCVAAGLRQASRYIAMVMFCALALIAMTIVLGLVAHFSQATDYPRLAGSSRPRAIGGLAAVLVLGTYYGFATQQKIAFFESDYSDETPEEARRRNVKVAAIVVLLLLTLRQTLQLLVGG